MPIRPALRGRPKPRLLGVVDYIDYGLCMTLTELLNPNSVPGVTRTRDLLIQSEWYGLEVIPQQFASTSFSEVSAGLRQIPVSLIDHKG
jgi:hypothetical protein